MKNEMGGGKDIGQMKSARVVVLFWDRWQPRNISKLL